tara:strand:+ start:1344 stop:2690 length:1347 start_codon:yes stop_codon:yes gene_type:complete
MADFFKIGQAAYGGGADASKAIGEGLEKGRQVFMAYLEGQKAKREKADNITKQYLAQIPNVNAITKIPEWMRADVNNYLVSEKQKYSEVSKRLGSMSSSDPAYMDAVSELQNIKNNFAYLNDQLNQFQEDSKQYVLDVDNDKISEGFKNGEADKYNKTAAVYTGDAKLTIRNGNLFFNVDGKSFNYSRGEIGDYFKKNFGSQTTLLNLAKQVETDARKGFTFESSRKRYEGEIDAVLNKGGKEAVLSMVYDTNPEFITGGGLQTPEIETALLTENYDEAARLVKQELMTGIEAEHASIYQPPEPPKTKLTSQQEAQNRAIEAYNTIMENPVEYAKTKLRGGFKSAEGDSKITLEIAGEEKTYNLKNQDQFLEFMEVARENSGIATGNSEGAELTRNEFFNLIKNKSLEVSRFYKTKAKERKKGVERLREQLMPQFFAPQTLSDLPILK